MKQMPFEIHGRNITIADHHIISLEIMFEERDKSFIAGHEVKSVTVLNEKRDRFLDAFAHGGNDKRLTNTTP